jgi:hypothetical protein
MKATENEFPSLSRGLTAAHVAGADDRRTAREAECRSPQQVAEELRGFLQTDSPAVVALKSRRFVAEACGSRSKK